MGGKIGGGARLVSGREKLPKNIKIVLAYASLLWEEVRHPEATAMRQDDFLHGA